MRTTAHTPVGLERGLGFFGATLVTIGSIVGTGIFLVPSDVARAVPDATLVLIVCATSGLFTLAGALTYAELGTLFPRAGGIYHFLKEAYGPRWGFLYGWTAFLVIMSGGIAALAVGFATYLGAFWTWAAPDHEVVSLAVGAWTWTLSGTQVVGAAAIALVTAVNHFGLAPGARLQQTLVVVTAIAILAIIVVAFQRGTAPVSSPAIDTRTHLQWIGGFGVATVAMLWTYDGWYGLTFSAGELRDPRRDLPRGLVAGTLAVCVLYVLLLAAYLRAVPIAQLMEAARPAELAAMAIAGSTGGRVVAGIALLSALGCLASTVLYSSRLYPPMARDGLFFAPLAVIHPRWRTPVRSLWTQSAWAMLLALTGTYSRLYTYVTCAVVLFHIATAVAVFTLRRKRPEIERPYRVFGYPFVPGLFVLACVLLLVTALFETPLESCAGFLVVALGLPVYGWFRRRRGAEPTHGQ